MSLARFVSFAALALLTAVPSAHADHCDCYSRSMLPAWANTVPTMPCGPVAAIPMATAVQCMPCVPVVAAPRYEERTVERTVMVPKLVREKRNVRATELQRVEREREVTVYETRPETRIVKQKRTVLEPVERVRKERYTVMRPVVEEREREYTVQVPTRVRRTAEETVLQPRWRNETEDYTVMVPRKEKRRGTRTSYRCVPERRAQTVMQQSGYWKTEQYPVTTQVSSAVQTASVAAASGIGGCSPCVPVSCGCQTTMMTRRVFVPQTVQRQQHYTAWVQRPVQESYDYEVVTWHREQRQRTVKVQSFERVSRPYEYTEIVYRPERRTRTERVERMVEEQRTRDVRVTEYVPREKTEEVRVTEYREVPVKRRETYTALVPREVEREVTVEAYRMVPKKVAERVRVPVDTVIR